MNTAVDTKTWIEKRAVPEQVDKYLFKGRSFIDAQEIFSQLESNRKPSPQRIKDILAKSLAIF